MVFLLSSFTKLYDIKRLMVWGFLLKRVNFSFHLFTRYNVIAKSAIYYFLPLSIIGVLYALMARQLHVSAREMPGELAGPQRAQARARRHVARMVVTFVIGKLTHIPTERRKKGNKLKQWHNCMVQLLL